MAGRPAVFLDRDDTLNKDCPYCRRPEDIVLLPTVGEGIRVLNDAGLALVVVTNQSGIGRGFFSEADLHAMHAKMQADLAKHGAHLDGLFFCPHPPEEMCPDRKPLPGMLQRASSEMGLDLKRSAMIGDRGLDVELAWNAGCLGVIVPSARGRDELPGLPRTPDFVAPNFLAAAKWVAQRLGPDARRA